MTYAVVYTKTANGYNARVPDLPECTANAGTMEEVQRLIRQMVMSHVKALTAMGRKLPLPTTQVDNVTVLDEVTVAGEDVA